MIFNSDQNKELVWNILLEQNLFNGLSNDTFLIAKENFDNLFLKYDKHSITNIEKNKIIIKEYSIYIKNLKDKKKTNKNISNIEVLKPLEEVKIKIDDDFKNKQEEFISLIKKNIPDEPKFEDEEEVPFTHNELQDILEKTRAERELIKPKIEQTSIEKHVSFNINNISETKSNENNKQIDKNISSTDIIDKLKKIPVNNLDDNKLDIIISNQNKILTLLENLQKI